VQLGALCQGARCTWGGWPCAENLCCAQRWLRPVPVLGAGGVLGVVEGPVPGRLLHWGGWPLCLGAEGGVAGARLSPPPLPPSIQSG